MKGYRQLKKLQGIGATRLRLGLTQELFALELGMSRSLLSKVENRERSLPLAALAKLSEMEKRLSLHPALPGGAMHLERPQHASLPTADFTMVRRAREEPQLKELRKKLEQMQQSYAVLGASMACMEQLMQADPGYPSNPGSVYLQIQCYTLQCKLKKCGPTAQNGLHLRIQLLEARMELQQVLRQQRAEPSAYTHHT